MTQVPLPNDVSEPARSILHPTDFTSQSEVALAHALRLALSNRANLHMLHVGAESDDAWDEFPSVRTMLHRWGMIAEDAPRSDVVDLGIGVRKVIGDGQSVADSIEGYCQRHPIDMIVLATAARHGLAAWLKPSTAQRIASQVSTISIPTLFVPANCRGCVSMESGEVTMDHVLVPVDHQPQSESAVERGLRAIALYGSQQANLTLLHVGSDSQFPNVQIPDGPWQTRRSIRQGDPASEILAAADECDANLIIMVTEGTDGLLDIIRGTTTEQVMREAPCPVLAVPVQDR